MVDKTVQLAGVVAVVVIAALVVTVTWIGSLGGAFVLGTDVSTVAGKWCWVDGYFVEAVIIENNVGGCTYAGDNYDPFVYGISTADGVEYADTCVEDDPNINMIEYSCKTVYQDGITTYYLVQTEGTCTLDCRTKGRPSDRNACYRTRRVKCGTLIAEDGEIIEAL